MFGPVYQALICLSVEEVADNTGHKLMEKVEESSMMIVGGLQGIIGLQLRPYNIIG